MANEKLDAKSKDAKLRPIVPGNYGKNKRNLAERKWLAKAPAILAQIHEVFPKVWKTLHI